MTQGARKPPDKREVFLDKMTDHLLAHGLASGSLRPLAAAAGTSDRMLLYYFADKTEILTAIFARVAERFMPLLAGADMSPLPPTALRVRLWTTFRADAAWPFIRLYLEICIAASRGEQPHRTFAAAMASAFMGWIEPQLDLPAHTRQAVAGLMLAEVDGLLILDAIGLTDIAERASVAPA
jgi:AcrR family transcriptional regulator